MKLQVLLLVVALAATALAKKINLEEYGTTEERKSLIEAAIQEAKDEKEARKEKASVQSESEKKGKYSATQLLSKFFKRPSPKAKKIGEAQLSYERMVRKAERKLSENRRHKMASSQSAEEKAEAVAEELFHKAGSLLTKEEIAHMWQESGCLELRERPSCNFPTVNQFRTIDGTCNNRRMPLYGASGTNFKRIVPAYYEDGCSSLRGTLQFRTGFFFDPITPQSPPNPSPRLVSLEIVQNVTKDEEPFSHLLMQWGQFLDHDMDLGPELEEECEGCEESDICQPIRVTDGDPAFGEHTPNEGECIPLRRSLPACPTEQPLSFEAREQINDLTSYIDGSMVYGSNDFVAAELREFRDGLLRVGPNFPGNKPSLPIDNNEVVACLNAMDCFLCGDIRCNEQFSLTVIHTIWVREHNRCARELAGINPHWDDERLYQECRKIVGALIQKITYEDYLPKVLGVQGFNDFIGPYPGYMPEVDASIPNSFATAAYRYGHSLVRPKFARLDENYMPLNIGPANLRDLFFNPDQFRISLGTDAIARGWLDENARKMDEFVNSVLTTQLFETSAGPGLDLASLNIQRGREHGLPPYVIFRNFCEKQFRSLNLDYSFENVLTLVRFLRLYGDLETVDLWPAGLAERRVDGALLGPTFACIFGITFQAVRNGDRFWYERPFAFKPNQRASIQQDSLSGVLCSNLDSLPTVQPDAFLTNQTRVPCSQIDRVDLSLWKEEVCYFRVGVQPRRGPESLIAITRSVGRFVTSSGAFPGAATETFRCIQMQCPTRTRDTKIMAFSDPLMGFSVDPSLPGSTSSEAGTVYEAEWPLSQLEAGQGGVFFSLEECERSSQAALVFEGADVARKQDEAVKVPDSVLNELDEEDKQSDGKAETKKEEVAKVASDADLMKELEDALKSLQ